MVSSSRPQPSQADFDLARTIHAHITKKLNAQGVGGLAWFPLRDLVEYIATLTPEPAQEPVFPQMLKDAYFEGMENALDVESNQVPEYLWDDCWTKNLHDKLNQTTPETQMDAYLDMVASKDTDTIKAELRRLQNKIEAARRVASVGSKARDILEERANGEAA